MIAHDRVINMSTKGIIQSIETRHKIGLANQKDRQAINEKIREYIINLPKGQLPSIVSASLHAGINEKNLINYELSTPDNSEVRFYLNTIRDLAKEALLNNSLNKKWDSKTASLLLNAEHGLKETPTQLTQNNIFNGISPEILSEAMNLSRSAKSKELKE